MPAPRTEDLPRVPVALAFYRVSAAVTGVFLLLLVVMMVTRYGFGMDLASGVNGPISLEPTWWLKENGAEGAVNLSTIILIVHGWLYVVYLVCDFWLWRLVRYSFGYFCFVALGGIIPFISFWFEWKVPHDIRARLRSLSEERGSSAPEARIETSKGALR